MSTVSKIFDECQQENDDDGIIGKKIVELQMQ